MVAFILLNVGLKLDRRLVLVFSAPLCVVAVNVVAMQASPVSPRSCRWRGTMEYDLSLAPNQQRSYNMR